MRSIYTDQWPNILSDVHESPVIQDIIKYNEIDCRVLWEIINYLRKNHT